MHYMSIEWGPAAVALGSGLLVVGCVHVAAWLARRSAVLRTQRKLEQVLDRQHDHSG
jgi:hypothetical protein